jgi:hypothetical protein
MSQTDSTTVDLNDTQLVVLSAAAQRADGSLLPFPQRPTLKGATLSKAIEALCSRKLAVERPIGDDEVEWRHNEDGRPLGLFITTGGLLALGVDEAQKNGSSHVASTKSRQRKAPSARHPRNARKTTPRNAKQRVARAQTKQDLVIQTLRRQCGVSIDDIISKTTWQPHSVRGFLSAVVRKKLKLPLVSEVGKDGVRRYHIAVIAPSKA